jgi:hypothetical protein
MQRLVGGGGGDVRTGRRNISTLHRMMRSNLFRIYEYIPFFRGSDAAAGGRRGGRREDREEEYFYSSPDDEKQLI